MYFMYLDSWDVRNTREIHGIPRDDHASDKRRIHKFFIAEIVTFCDGLENTTPEPTLRLHHQQNSKY
jgi:hypothetical protein